MQQISEDFRRKREIRFGTKNGYARLVRNRWPTNTVCQVMAEWSLTDGEARGVVYAQASQRTIDKIEQHPRGGWPIILEVKALVLGATVFDFIEKEQVRLAEQQRRAEAELARLDQAARDLPFALGLRGGVGAGEPRGPACEDRTDGR